MLLAAGLVLGPPAQAQPPVEPSPELLAALLAESPSGHISQHEPTGPVRFFRAGPEPRATPTPRPGQTPEQVAAAFLRRFGPLFGAAQPERDLAHARTQAADRGRSFVRFEQTVEGVPVLGGEMVVQVSEGRVVSAHGRLMPTQPLVTAPRLTEEQAQAVALASVAKSHPGVLLESGPAELWVYSPELLGPEEGPARLTWHIEITSPADPTLRELVLVDAHLGKVALRFSQANTGLARYIYSTSGTALPGTLVRAEGDPATGDPDADLLYDYLGDTYAFYWSQHGRDSLDGLGLALVGTVHYAGANCPNAFWNGSQIAFCDGMVADDVVAHELTHGLTEHTSELFYYYQSGAINESLSDIWGEFVDLTNGRGDDTDAVRWLVGENAYTGPLRNLASPATYGDPDRMASPYWDCDPYAYDGGGVHTNSGVLNKTAYLLTDGGSFNGQTVQPLGIAKVAAIFYELQVHLLTSASDYRDVYDLLPQACYNLIGAAGVTPQDCTQVELAVTATEMHLPPALCGQAEAPLCPAGQDCATLFYDDLEDPAVGNWTKQLLAGSYQGWFYPQNTHPYDDLDLTYATSGVTNFWGDDPERPADFAIALSRDVYLPPGQASFLHFRHSYQFEAYPSNPLRYDGGVLEFSIDGGSSWHDAGPLFDHNGYNGMIASGHDNPLSGRQAFVGTSYGYTSSRLDLSALAGQRVRFRFRIGSDQTVGHWGWFVDDIQVVTVVPPSPPTPIPTPASCSLSINGGAPYTNTTQVTLALVPPPGATRMQVSNDNEFEAAEWETPVSAQAWEIRAEGSYTVPRVVYAQFGDDEGSVLAACSDDIILDVTPPEATLKLSWSAPGEVRLSLWATDDVSGVDAMQVGDEPDLAGALWQPYREMIVWEPQGTRVYVRLRDAAGNSSPIYWASVGGKVHLPLLVH